MANSLVFPRDIEIHTPRIEITIEGRQEKCSIDIGCQHLLCGSSSGDFPGEFHLP